MTNRISQPGRSLRVVIADHEPRARAALRALLDTQRLGLPDSEALPVEVVGEAADGQEALRLVAECRPDVAIVDIRMPRLDGLAAAHRIKAQWPGVRIVVMTLYAAQQAEALAAGADAFLLKGCPGEELRQALVTLTSLSPL